MTLIEPHLSVCSGQRRPANVVCRFRLSQGMWSVWLPAVERDSPRPEGPSHSARSWLKMLTKEGVHNVHTRGFGFGCTDAGLVPIGEVFGGVAVFQGLAPGSSPISGTCFPCSGTCLPLSVDILCCEGPLRGPFSLVAGGVASCLLPSLASGIGACYLFMDATGWGNMT
jgi:hypothetical protein